MCHVYASYSPFKEKKKRKYYDENPLHLQFVFSCGVSTELQAICCRSLKGSLLCKIQFTNVFRSLICHWTGAPGKKKSTFFLDNQWFEAASLETTVKNGRIIEPLNDCFSFLENWGSLVKGRVTGLKGWVLLNQRLSFFHQGFINRCFTAADEVLRDLLAALTDHW